MTPPVDSQGAGKRIYITKKRDNALDLALSLDDYMYEKFRRLQDKLHKDYERLIKNPQKVFSVVADNGDYLEELMITDVQMTETGSRIVVAAPRKANK